MEIIIKENGPMLVSGDFSFVDSTGNKRYLGKKVFICRCGGSSNMPFCDGTHKTKGVKKV